MTDRPKRTLRSLLLVSLSALLAYAAIDACAWAISPHEFIREVEDAIDDLESSDPHVLVVGSSHARTFHVLGDELSRRTEGQVRTLAVPVEFGKWASYDWVLQNRLAPYFDERDRHGQPVRTNLRHFVLVTEWWDSTDIGGGGNADNLPSRAWTWRDFAADALTTGLTPFNRNYLQTRFRRLLRASRLVQDRGYAKVLPDVKRMLLRAGPVSESAELDPGRVLSWQRTVENGRHGIMAPFQVDRITDALEWAHARGLEITIVLYPRMPITITDAARDGTLRVFHEFMVALAERYGARLIDSTTDAPLEDRHFASDFDHVTREGNELLTHWYLDGSLDFLLGADESGEQRQ